MRSKFNKFLTLLAVLIFGISNVWADEVTVGFTTGLGAKNATTSTRSIVDVDHVTVTHMLNSGTSGALAAYNKSDKSLYYGSSTATYCYNEYKWNVNTGTTFNNNYVGFQVDVEDGYKLSLSELELTLAVSAGFTCKVEITDGTNNLYSSDSWAIANNGKNGTNGINPTFTAVGNPDLQDLTGTFYVRVQLAFNSTGKYLCCPIFTITGDLVSAAPATNYTVTIDPNGGSYASTPDGWTYSAGVYTKSIASGTSFSAPDGLTKGTDDLTWKDGSDNPITFPVSITGDITFVAQWAPHAASSDATLSALSVAGCTLNETFDPATTAYTITLPFYGAMPVVGDVTATKNDPNAEDPEVSISGNVITVHCVAEDGTTTKDYTITVTISPAPTASSSINIEQLILDNSKAYNIGAALDAAHIGYVSKDALDSLKSVAEKADRNEPYLGLKFKTPTSKVTIIVPDGEYLKVKFGYIDGSAGLKVSVNGSAAAAPSLTSGVYTLAASAGIKEVVFTQTGSNKTVVYKQIKINEDVDAVTLPWLVTYTVGEHGTCAKAKETWKGSALTLPAVTPESGWDFDGWFTAASAGTKVGDAGDSYTPTADVELFAQYTAQASPFDLTALTYKIGTGAATNVGYVDGTFTYNIVLPYAPSYDAITVAPTLKEASSSLKGDEVLTVTSLPGAATFTVVEDGGADERLYTINFTKAAKDGVSIIKAVATATGNLDITGENLTGVLKGAAHSYTSGSYKFDTKRYFMLQLKDGEDFQAGDVVEINVSTVNDANGFTLYSAMTGDDFAAGDLIIDTHDGTGAAAALTTGIHKVTLPGSYAGSNKLYVARAGGTDKYLNAGINQVEVKRSMNPVLTAIQFNSTDVEVTSTTVAATLPQGTNLGTMTVTPTIVWNGAGSAAPTAAWAWGANTYRVTDKDGDYTDYTITLTEALAPSAAPTITTQPADANYYEGATIDALEVVATGSGDLSYQWYLGSDEIDGATAATYTPTVSAIGTYVYHCVVTNTETGHPATSLASDNATITISEDPAAIKLLDGATVNHTNFITGVTADETVEFMGNTVNYAKFSGTVGGVNGVKDLTRVIAYNATTTQTKIKVSVHNNSTNARSCYVKGLVEGADAAVDLATISLTNKEDKISDWITFDNAANRTIYIFVSSDAGDVYFTQVKVIESGTDLKMAGEAGYSLNFDHGRFFGVKDVTAHFEGLDVEVKSSDCQPLSTTVVKLASSSMSFTVATPLTLTVTTNNNKTYYVTKGSAGTDNETAKTGATDFDLTAGTWYITGGSSNVEITNIAFALPKAEEPTITTQPASNHTFSPGNLTATVEAEVNDGGTLSYQWYDASDDSEVDGATSATLTTTTEGTYYVIVTNSLAGHQNSSIKSDEATLAYRDASDATLSALSVSEGTLDPTFDPAELNYRVDLPEGTVDVPTLSATATMDGYANVAINNATAFVNYEAVSTVTVTSEDLSDTKVYTVHFYVDHAIATLVDVTDDITWDFSKANDGGAATSGLCNEEIFANVAGIVNNGDFESDNLIVTANKFANNKLQASMIKFHTTVDGLIKVIFSHTGNNKTEGRALVVNGTHQSELSHNQDLITYYCFVPAGDVVLTVTTGDGGNMLNFTSIKFMKKAAPDHARDAAHGDSWMAPGELGTICLENGAIATGGDILELVGKNAEGKVVFATVSHMEPGKPYLFESKSNAMNFYYTDETPAENPDNSGAMKGSFIDYTLNDVENVYYFSGHALWRVSGDHLNVVAHRAYVKLDEVDELSSAAPAPGRRYITMNVHGQNQTTGIEDLMSGDAPKKVLIEGTLFILRGEKVFDATGRLVK